MFTDLLIPAEVLSENKDLSFNCNPKFPFRYKIVYCSGNERPHKKPGYSGRADTAQILDGFQEVRPRTHDDDFSLGGWWISRHFYDEIVMDEF